MKLRPHHEASHGAFRFGRWLCPEFHHIHKLSGVPLAVASSSSSASHLWCLWQTLPNPLVELADLLDEEQLLGTGGVSTTRLCVLDFPVFLGVGRELQEYCFMGERPSKSNGEYRLAQGKKKLVSAVRMNGTLMCRQFKGGLKTTVGVSCQMITHIRPVTWRNGHECLGLLNSDRLTRLSCLVLKAV